MKSKLLLLLLTSFNATSAEPHVKEHWAVKIGSGIYNVEVIETDGDVVRIKYEDGLIGRATKGDIKWLTKLSSEPI